MPQLFLNNFQTQFIANVKAAPDSASPALELDYGVLRVSDGAAGLLLNPGAGNWYVLTAFKRSGSAESDYEVLRVTAVDNAVIGECRLTVLRGQEGTTPKSYVAGDIVELRLTAGGMGQYVQTADARLSNPRAPTGAAGGVLSGSYPNPGFAQAMATAADLGGKVDKVAGKGLSANDYTNADLAKLAGIAEQATKNATDAALRDRASHTGAQAIATVTGLQASLDAKAPNVSPIFTGTPAVPTAAAGTSTTQAASTAFVRSEVATAIAALVATAPTTLDTLKEIAAALGDDPNFAATMTAALGAKAPRNNPVFTGTVSGITKEMVGLGNADNTPDASKPVSTAQQAALNAKVDKAVTTLTPANMIQFFTQMWAGGSGFYRGDGDGVEGDIRWCAGFFSKAGDTWSFVTAHYLTKNIVSYAGQFAGIATGTWSIVNLHESLQAKQDKLVSATNIKTVNGISVLGSGNIDIGAEPDVIRRPLNVSPAQGEVNINETVTLKANPFMSLYGVTMAASRWQISTDPEFGTTVVDWYVPGQATHFRVGPSILNPSTLYYWRARYESPDADLSRWSSPTNFTTSVAFNDYIDIPAPTPVAYGDPFEGGFYIGMVWHDIAESSTSMSIGTGVKTFTVHDMNANPIVYPGQELEVRNANATMRFIGTVFEAVGTQLTVNVGSVQGSGAGAAWFVMARHRIIIAPKALGENSSVAIKNSVTETPAGAKTIANGFRATRAMVEADTSIVYPAAHWCRSLSINGWNDWYLPARDELELFWRNLKPITSNNAATTSRVSSNYQGFGESPSASTGAGVNANSSPTGGIYTATIPGQTAALAFRTGNAEAFIAGVASQYWSSSPVTPASGTSVYQIMGTSSSGEQYGHVNTTLKAVRAVRRSIV